MTRKGITFTSAGQNIVFGLLGYIYLDLQSGTFTGSGAGLPTPAFFWIWSGSFSKSLYVNSQGFAFFVVRISLKVNPLLTNNFA